MSIVDDRGRVFGRLNLVDCALVVFVIVLVPMAYGAYLLFREPQPTLTEVAPRSLQQGPGQQVEIHGQHFRPYMRATFGDEQGLAFWFVNAGTAVVPLPALKPGQYDIVLYDYMREVGRLPKALTIEPALAPPKGEVELAGVITSLTPEQARAITRGYKVFGSDGPIAEVLSVGTPAPDVLTIAVGDGSTVPVAVPDRVQLPARLRTSCVVAPAPDGMLRCSVDGVVLARHANVRFAGVNAGIVFHIDEVQVSNAHAK